MVSGIRRDSALVLRLLLLLWRSYKSVWFVMQPALHDLHHIACGESADETAKCMDLHLPSAPLLLTVTVSLITVDLSRVYQALGLTILKVTSLTNLWIWRCS
jgi:hypothetical protein